MKDIFGNEHHVLKRNMRDYFIVPPFSVLNSMDVDWLKRKRRWNDLINDVGDARLGALIAKNGKTESEVNLKVQKLNNGVSILDAVLVELMLKWFTEENYKTFDPFAGDTVFGFVSGYLNRPFEGIELRPEQVKFNQIQCDRENLECKYICDTSENMDKYIKAESKDFMFTCPPYADLEKYSDLKDDLSNMSHKDFFKLLSKILGNTYKKLKNNRFACVVVGEVRDKNGIYISLVPKTIKYMLKAGFQYYNELILVNSVGTLPLRATRSMNAGRKVGKRHQNVLVFYKGDTKQIKNNFSEIMSKNQFYESKNL